MVKAFKILQHDEKTEESKERQSGTEDDANFEEASVIATDEIQQFEEHEEEHGTALATWRRSSCFTHSLQLIVKTCSPVMYQLRVRTTTASFSELYEVF